MLRRYGDSPGADPTVHLAIDVMRTRPDRVPALPEARRDSADRYDGRMSTFDNAKDVADKVQDVTEEKVDKLGDLIDEAADKLDEKTGGKYSDKIDTVVDPIQDPVDATAGAEEPPNPPGQ